MGLTALKYLNSVECHFILQEMETLEHIASEALVCIFNRNSVTKILN